MRKLRNISLLLLAGAASSSTSFDSTFQFRPERVLTAQRHVQLLSLIDMNDDGRPDILARDGARLVWLENPKWIPHVIADGAASAEGASQFGWVRCVRRLARVEADHLVVYEEPTLPLDPQAETKRRPTAVATESWSKQIIQSGKGIRALAWADLDGDGSDELAVAGTSGVCVYKLGIEGSWNKIVVDANNQQANVLFARDLNNDRRAELVASADESGLNVVWFENRFNQRRRGK